jgi:type II secretory pathway pseudopilin PulG
MENTAKNFALQLGSLISLYVSLGALIALLFGIITILYPDTAQYAWEGEGARATIRTTIAMLVVFFPTYIVLTRLVNNVRRTEQGMYLTLTKWLIYLSLLVGGGVLLGDLVMVLNSFLNGELTLRFILKALSVLLVVGGAFVYYVLDVRGHWQKNESQSIRYGIVVAVVVLIAIVYGFTMIETPSEVREKNIDQTQLSDLMNIQSSIQSYAIVEGKLPATLEEAFNALPTPKASSGRAEYRYEVKSATTFELCAEFASPTSESDRMYYADYEPTEPMMVKESNNWNHGAGEWCFKRIVNPVPDLKN